MYCITIGIHLLTFQVKKKVTLCDIHPFIHPFIHPSNHSPPQTSIYSIWYPPPPHTHTHKLLYRYLWCVLYTNAYKIYQPVLPNHTCNACICFLVCFHSFLALPRCMWALTCAQRPWRETSAPCIWRRGQSTVGANRKDVTIQVQFKVLNYINPFLKYKRWPIWMMLFIPSILYNTKPTRY